MAGVLVVARFLPAEIEKIPLPSDQYADQYKWYLEMLTNAFKRRHWPGWREPKWVDTKTHNKFVVTIEGVTFECSYEYCEQHFDVMTPVFIGGQLTAFSVGDYVKERDMQSGKLK